MDDQQLASEAERLIVDYSFAWEGREEIVVERPDLLARWSEGMGFAGKLRLGDSNEEIDEAMRAVEADGRQYIWVVGPATLPADLPDRLADRGLLPLIEWDALVLDDLTTDIAVNPEVRIEELSAENAAEFLPLIKLHSQTLSDEEAMAVPRRYLERKQREATIYLAWLDGRVGGYAILRLEPNGIAYLRQGTTLPAMQQRGIYLSLVKHRLQVATEGGATVAVVQAIAATSAPILRKRGFRRVGGIRGCVVPPPGLKPEQSAESLV